MAECASTFTYTCTKFGLVVILSNRRWMFQDMRPATQAWSQLMCQRRASRRWPFGSGRMSIWNLGGVARRRKSQTSWICILPEWVHLRLDFWCWFATLLSQVSLLFPDLHLLRYLIASSTQTRRRGRVTESDQIVWILEAAEAWEQGYWSCSAGGKKVEIELLSLK